MNWKFRENSLDAIRLFAASEVAVEHTFEFMFAEKTGTLFFEILKLFPGVPIFFFISGYLISKAFERSPGTIEYTKNRILRLYPALIVCVAINLVMVASTGYFSEVSPSLTDIFLLFSAKSSFLQFYNPDFMRAFGDGVLNGSLWTVCVELQFYILTPILYSLFGQNKQLKNYVIVIGIILFLGLNRLLVALETDYSQAIWWKLYRVSFAPWIYMFFVGVLFQKNFSTFSRLFFRIPFYIYLPIYICAALLLTRNGYATGNGISPVLFVLLIPMLFRAAYTAPRKINSLMKGNDISYGIYIWHMPIVNQMLYLGHDSTITDALIALALSIVIAVISWKLIEKPTLLFKRMTINTRLSKTKSTA